jgi:hypothetical protein
MLLKSEVEWHDLRMDPEDLPSAEEGVFVTIETLDGEKRVWGDVFYNDDAECWCTFCQNDLGYFERTMVWYPVIGWAYNPSPMPDFL